MASVDKIKADIERMAEKLAKAQAKEALKATREKAKQASDKRKADNRAKYDLGGLAVKAGLSDLDKGAVLGGMMALAEAIASNPDKAAQWKQRGDAALAGKAGTK